MCHFCKWSIYKGCLNNFDFNKFYLLDDICNIVIFRDQRIASHIQDSIISVITLFINVAFEVMSCQVMSGIGWMRLGFLQAFD